MSCVKFQALLLLTPIRTMYYSGVPEASTVWEKLYDAGVLIRDFSRSPYLENCLRVSIGTEEENAVFLAELQKILGA